MADFAIDYSNLYTVQAKLRALADKAGSGGATGAFKELGDAGSGERTACLGTSGLSLQFNYFYHHSVLRTQKAHDGLNKLADTFQAVSNIFFDADSQISGAAGLLGDSLGLSDWKNKKAAHDKWQADQDAWNAYLAKIGATGYFHDHPDDTLRTACHAADAPAWCAAWINDANPPVKPGDEPPKPGDPPTSYHHQDEHGSIDAEVTVDKDGNVMTEHSKITNPQGQTFESTTTYDGPPNIVRPGGDAKPYDTRGYTIVTKYGDGTTSTSTVTVNHDGSGSMTVVSGTDAPQQYTRSGPDAKWVLIDPATGQPADQTPPDNLPAPNY